MKHEKPVANISIDDLHPFQVLSETVPSNSKKVLYSNRLMSFVDRFTHLEFMLDV